MNRWRSANTTVRCPPPRRGGGGGFDEAVDSTRTPGRRFCAMIPQSASAYDGNGSLPDCGRLAGSSRPIDRCRDKGRYRNDVRRWAASAGAVGRAPRPAHTDGARTWRPIPSGRWRRSWRSARRSFPRESFRRCYSSSLPAYAGWRASAARLSSPTTRRRTPCRNRP